MTEMEEETQLQVYPRGKEHSGQFMRKGFYQFKGSAEEGRKGLKNRLRVRKKKGNFMFLRGRGDALARSEKKREKSREDQGQERRKGDQLSGSDKKRRVRPTSSRHGTGEGMKKTPSSSRRKSPRPNVGVFTLDKKGGFS